MPEAPRRILIIRPSALGDVCRSVPVLASLRAAFPRPHTRIDWLVQDSFAEAVRDHPALDGVVPFSRTRLGLKRRAATAGAWSRGGGGGVIGADEVDREIGPRQVGGPLSAVSGTMRFVAALRRAQYDMVLDCQGLFRSGFFALMTGAKRRVGLAGAREGGWLFLSKRVDAPETMHTVDRMLEIVRGAGVTARSDGTEHRLYVSETRERVLDRLGVRGMRYAVIAPGSRWVGKRWPAERFGAVTRAMLEGGRVERVVVVGSRSERADAAAVFETPGMTRDERIIDAMGGTGVGELMAVVKHAAVVVGNDSAVIHMAVGFDRPLVGLYGPTDIAKVGPWRRSEGVIQHLHAGDTLDHKHPTAGVAMMERIGVEEVLARIT